MVLVVLVVVMVEQRSGRRWLNAPPERLMKRLFMTDCNGVIS